MAVSTVELAGFRNVESIYRSARTQVHRAVRLSDGVSIVLKGLAPGRPEGRAVARLEQEFRVLRSVQINGVVRAYALHDSALGPLLELEDAGPVSLAEHCRAAMGVGAFLELAPRLARTLASLHDAGVVHRDVNPSNIAFDPTTGHARLIDFDIASRLTRESTDAMPVERLEGTPGYLSPEQTGRMNRPLDRRSDLYALGATFYRILAGRLPFLGRDPLELVHATIARAPTPLAALRPDLPPVLTDIVMRLLAKMAEDRYQSAEGLADDLDRVGHQWAAKGAVATFPLREGDRSARFTLPDRIYGRDVEVRVLVDGLARARRGEAVAFAVRGPAGIGKSAVVRELDRHLAEAGGWLVTAKFDQLRRSQPYQAIADAMRELVRRVLGHGDAEVAVWRGRLEAALGPNAALVAEVVPDAALLLGHPPPPPPLPPAEARSRQHVVVRAFLRAFHAPAHPLVLFLDDTHWADTASIGLIESLLTDWEGTPPIVALAWRTEEVAPTGPLHAMLDRIPLAVLRTLTLAPMAAADIALLLRDTLGCDPEDATALSGRVIRKTGGNPFFVRAFLRSLHDNGQLRFEPRGRLWLWKLDAIDAVPVSENVVDLLAGRLSVLEPQTRRILSLAACIGNRFELRTLAVAGDETVAAAASALGPAVEAGLVEPLGGGWNALQRNDGAAAFRFAHDRILQAAYEQLGEAERRRTHVGVGRLMLAEVGTDDPGERVFNIVAQLNLGLELLSDPGERHRVATLNLSAGRRARASAAFDTALTYLEAGIRLLGDGAWERDYDLAYGLYLEAAEAAVLAPGRTLPAVFLDVATPRARAVLDRVALHEIRVRDHLTRNENPEALRLALEALRWLGVDLPAKPNVAQVSIEFYRAKFALRGKTLEQLRALPVCTDPETIAIFRLIAFAGAPAYYASAQLMGILFCRLARLAVTRGVHAKCAYGFAGYALLLSAVFDDIPGAELYGKFSHDIVERLDAVSEYATVEVLWLAFVYARTHAFSTLPPLYERAQAGCLAVGDAERAGQCSLGVVNNGFHAGWPLADVEARARMEVERCRTIGQTRPKRAVMLIAQFAANLRGQASVPWVLDGDVISRASYMSALEMSEDRSGLACAHVYEAMLAYWFGRHDEARVSLGRAALYINNIPGATELELYHWVGAMNDIALARAGRPFQSSKAKKVLKRMKKRAGECAANYASKVALLEAELASWSGADDRAIRAYDLAILRAHEHGLRADHALGLELAARHFIQRTQTRSAIAYFSEARRSWMEWGAMARVPGLERLAEQLRGFDPKLLPAAASAGSEPTTVVDTGALDLESVVKTAAVISSELDLKELLRRLVSIVVENAGADGGLLALDTAGKLTGTAKAHEGEVTIDSVGGLAAGEAMPHASPLMNYVARTRETVVIDDVSRDERFFRGTGLPRSAMALPLVNGARLVGVMYLENTLATGAFTESRTGVVNMLASQAAISIENARLYESLRTSLDAQTRLTRAYERFLPKQFLDQLGHPDILGVQLGDQVQRETSVLFADIRGFTTMCEEIGPARSFAFVNSYLRWMEPAIHGHGGYVNQFLGDGIMALFPGNADEAVHGALAMLAAVDAYNRERAQDGEPPIRIGIGVNTATLMVGVIGGHDRMDRGVIGDGTNVAARIEGMTKTYGASLLASGDTVARLSDPQAFAMRAIDRVVPVGRHEPLTIYEILDGEPDSRREAKKSTRTIFAAGLEHWWAARFDEALECFTRCASACPEDRAAEIFVERCHGMLVRGPGVAFETVTRLKEK